MDISTQISDILAHYWFDDNPYCGMPASLILTRLTERGLAITPDQLHSILREMQSKKEVAIREAELHSIPLNMQGNNKVVSEARKESIVFPKRVLLEPRDQIDGSKIGVYTKELRLGGSQIELKYFDRQVLDRYRQDPRYEFKEFDLCGHITVSDTQPMKPTDIIYLRFGVAYRQDSTPVVAVILWDLGALPKKQQQHWASHEIREQCQPDPDFVKQNFDAVFVNRISPQTALLGEMQEINKICNLAGETKLFRETHEPYTMPELGRLTLPTAEKFNYFVLELDKLLSDNINKDFFEGRVELKDANGREKGTLTLLKEYLHTCVPDATTKDVGKIVKPLKKVRQYRQRPAHQIAPNTFNVAYWEKQRNLLEDTVNAIRFLRETFVEYFKLKDYTPPN